MAPFRKAIGAVKDQTSIGLAKVSSNIAPDLDVAIVKATSHENDPAEERHIREILNLTSYSRGYVNACVATISKRLGKTHDWIVALKVLMLIHRLLLDGDPSFQQEILYATRRGTRLLNMSDFRDEAHSNSWDHSAFVRTYALYLDQQLERMLYELKQSGRGGDPRREQVPQLADRPYSDHREFNSFGGGSDRGYGANDRGYGGGSDRGYGANDRGYGGGSDRGYGGGSDHGYGANDRGYGGGSDRGYGGRSDRGYGNGRSYEQEEWRQPEERRPATPLRDMMPERILGKMHHLQLVLDRFLTCRPTGSAKNSRMVLIALYPVVKESFQLYADICEILAALLDRFFDMEYTDCVKAFEAYASAAKQIDELTAFYGWCRDTGVARSSEYPEVQRITDKLLETLEEFMRDRARRPKSPERKEEPVPVAKEEEPDADMNSIKALPAPENYEPPLPPPPPPKEEPAPKKQETGDLLNLQDDAITADDQGNRFALALFNGGGATANANGTWEAFNSNGTNEPEVTSAWQTPAAEGKADWELALVETASSLSKQKATLAGGFDPLLLNGMYDQGAVRQHVGAQMSAGGSASSVALPGPGKSATPVLALPAPDGTVQTVGQDPFAASLSVPPPSYVQMSDMEKKQQLLVQEQVLWQQYQRNGMQGQATLAKLNNIGYYPAPPMRYGMPPVNGGGYYPY